MTLDREAANLAASYKKEVCKKYISIDPGQIDERLGGTVFYVSRKYDGELALLFWNGSECFSVNTGGKTRTGLPCLINAAKCFKAAGLKSAVIASELYKNEEKGRTRIFDVIACLGDKSLHDELRLALFGIVSLDGGEFKSTSYKEIHEKLAAISKDSKYIHPVCCETAGSREQVKELFSKWVDKEGAEGLVVRSELPMVYKLKNRHSLNAAVIGFSEGTGDTRSQIRTLLLALLADDGAFEVIGRCPGSGMDLETRKSLYPKLLDMKIESDYTEIDSNHVAFHMIRPEMILELSVNDVIFENSSGRIFNPRLKLNGASYCRTGTVPGISLVNPVFTGFKDNEKANDKDLKSFGIGLSQIDKININPYEEEEKPGAQSGKSKLLKREVYKKAQGAKLMVQKFLVWKTNKENAPGADYPAYVLAYTNFSSDRTDPLQNEVRISDSKEQILAMFTELVDKNIKKGWEKT
ncbi:MAG: hypothetical protein FWH35_00535 [Treponema sp.]|nr:hypothetical protein [Treponema sp.]